MKRKFIFLVMLFALLGGVNWNVLNAQQTITIGDTYENVGDNIFPTNCYYKYSITQQIYTSDELGGAPGTISSIAFKNYGSPSNTRNFSVYLANTSKGTFSSNTDMVNMASENLVFSGYVTYAESGNWMTINFTTPFNYTGENLIVCVCDNTGSYTDSNKHFLVFDTGADRALFKFCDTGAFNVANINGNNQGATQYTSGMQTAVNQIQLVVTPSGSDVKITPETIAFGKTMLGGYWNEKETEIPVSVKALNTTISDITCDNEFFVLKGIDYSTNPINFIVTFDKNATGGEKEGNIIVTYGDGEQKSIPVTASAYTPVEPDVIELAEVVSFSSGSFEDTPDFTTLNDNYNLPKEVNAGSTPDAVYHFTMEEGVLTVNVTGTNAIAAIYIAEELDLEEGIGPMANNNFKGIVAGPSVPTTFGPYTFDDGDLSDFTLIDADEDGQNWEFESQSKSIISYSWKGGVGKLSPTNFIYTKDKYLITETSKLLYHVKGNDQDKYSVVISEDMNSYTIIHTDVNVGDKDEEISLIEHAGKTVYIGFLHHDSYNYLNISIDNLVLTDGSSKSRSAEPQINAVQYPAGEYYLVAAAEEAFTVSIKTGALPEPGEFAYTAPADGATEQNNPKLTWDAAQYAAEYKVYLGTESTLTEENLVATVTTPSYQTEGLSNNTQYFWKVDAVNAKGTKKGEVYSFVTPLDVPQNVAVSASTIVEGETVTVTWNAIENVTYNVYVDDVQVNDEPITATSYELAGLAYNVSGYNVTVTANHTLGESPMSTAVNVKVGGSFTVTVTVTDGTNPIEGAKVTLKGADEWAKDELGNSLQYYTLEATTGADGIAVIENVRLLQPSHAGYSYYVITAEYGIYDDAYGYIYNYNEIVSGQNYPVDIYMELQRPENVDTDKEAYLVGDDVVLSWDAIAAAKGYNVYKADDEDPLNAELLTEATFTIEDVECGSTQYAVTAVYEDYGESNRESKYVQVTGEGSVIVTVTDGTNPIKGAKVVLAEKTYTTDADGKFEADIMEGYYTITVTRYDFEDKEGDVSVNCGETTETTIVMTSYPSATINNVRATETDGNALVTWEEEVDYEKYNVYRRNVATGSIEKLATETTLKQYTDEQWAGLENGTYQYGVSTYVSGETRGSAILYQDDFESYGGMEVPTGWTIIGNAYTKWFISSNYKNSGNKALWSNYLNNGDYYVVLPGQYNSSTTLSFYYRNDPYQGTTDKLRVCYSTSIDGPWTKLDAVYNNSSTTFAQAVVTFEQVQESSIYIAFCMESVYANGVYIDDVLITGAASEKESTITWSNELVKKSVLTLTFNNTAGDNNWNNPDNWAGGVLPTAEDNVVVNAVANITGTVAVNNLTINARLNVMPEAAFTVNGTIADANEYGNLYIEDGAQIFQKNEGVNAYFRMNIINPEEWSSDNKEGWQFISSPLLRAEVTAAATKYDNDNKLKDYDLYKYNGSLENEWVNHKGNYDFEAYFIEGRGYMYSHQARTIVTLGGTLNPATRFDYEVSYNGEKNPLANFHLLGNPFTFDMDWNRATFTDLVDGIAVVTSQGGWDYTQTTIPVGDGFFVQATGADASLSYDHNNVVPATRGSEKANSINVIASGKAGEDNVVVNFAGQAEGFNKLQNFNDAIATVYVTENGKNYGIANVDENTTEVALNFDAKEMGNYTISLDVNGEFETVTLVDRFTGVETNMLLEDEYSFTATSNDSPNRFVIKLANGQSTTANSQFVYQSGDELIINAEGAIEIIDMMGRVVYSSEANVSRVNVSNFNNAAYVVRALNEGKVQKVVIY